MITARVVALLFAVAAAVTVSVVAWGAPDELALGRSAGYPAGNVTNFGLDTYKVGSFSGMHRVMPSRPVRTGQDVLALRRGAALNVTYTFKDTTYSLQDYLDRQRVTGLLILRGDAIAAEHYQYARNDAHLFVSWSVAKSVTSLLIGLAADKGLITSLDDRAETYVPALRGTLYGQTTIRHLLRMSSGVRFTEDYSGADDIRTLFNAIFRFGPQPLETLASFDTRIAETGTRFKYATAETQVLCYVLRGATRKTIAELTEDWIWKPMGAEADAAWLVGRDGVEYCGGGFNATLRDYGRLGVLLARDGRLGDRQIVPAEYLRDATDAARQPPGFRVGEAAPGVGYGYQFWLGAGSSRSFSMAGVHGQLVHVHPASGLVLVHTAVWPTATDADGFAERSAFVRGLRAAVAGP
jgi:CubicO group peptidase (beta-lactamase class C family)